EGRRPPECGCTEPRGQFREPFNYTGRYVIEEVKHTDYLRRQGCDDGYRDVKLEGVGERRSTGAHNRHLARGHTWSEGVVRSVAASRAVQVPVTQHRSAAFLHGGLHLSKRCNHRSEGARRTTPKRHRLIRQPRPVRIVRVT